MILEVPGEPGSQLSERFLVGGGGELGEMLLAGALPHGWGAGRALKLLV